MNKRSELTTVISRARTISKLFIVWNVAVLVTAVVLRSSIMSDAVAAVFIRGVVYALGGGILLYLLAQMSRHIRSGWQRLRIITILAPIGVVAFIAFTPDLPVWFDVAQVVSAGLLGCIAYLIRGSALRSHFPATAKS